MRRKAETFQGAPCKNGHAGVRRADNRDCVDCAQLRYVRFIARNPERRAAAIEKYYRANAVVVKATAKTWKKANPEKVSVGKAAYQRDNADKHRANQHARRARKVAAGGRFSRADVDALHVSQDGMCAAHCGAFLCDGFEIDHVTALAAGGSNGPENLQLLCTTCNRVKGTLPMAAFMKSRGGGHFWI